MGKGPEETHSWYNFLHPNLTGKAVKLGRVTPNPLARFGTTSLEKLRWMEDHDVLQRLWCVADCREGAAGVIGLKGRR